MENIATSSALIVQNSALTSVFIFTGQLFWAGVTLIGVITIANKTFRSFVPKKK